MIPAERAAAAFTAEHGHAPTAVWSAPGRVNLIGEHTDYNDGYVLPFALQHRTATAVSPRGDGCLSIATIGHDGRPNRGGVFSIEQLSPGQPRGWIAYPAGVAWALRENGIKLDGANLVIAGDVPTGAGVSSSHALECSVALGLLHLAGFGLDSSAPVSRAEIARLVQRTENDFVGAPTGLLDQTASLNCIEAHALFFDVRSGMREQIPFDAGSYGMELLVIDSRVHHSHGQSSYGDRRRGCEQATRILGRTALRDVHIGELDEMLLRLPNELRPLVRHVVTENQRVLDTVDLLRAKRSREIGPLLTASHVSLRDDFQISCTELDLIVDTALESGATGARMIGGGFGGSALALTTKGTSDQIRQAIRSASERHHTPTPRVFTTTPAAGAKRDQ